MLLISSDPSRNSIPIANLKQTTTNVTAVTTIEPKLIIKKTYCSIELVRSLITVENSQLFLIRLQDCFHGTNMTKAVDEVN